MLIILDNRKTIKEIAQGLGVSRQAIYKKIKKEPLSTQIQPFLSTVDNIVYIDMDGIALLNSKFDTELLSTNAVNHSTFSDNRLIDSLQAQVDTLTEQNTELLAELNKEREYNRLQMDRLNELTNKLAILLEQSQQLQQNNQVLLAAHSIESKEKPNFFSRIFNRQHKENDNM